MPKNRLLLAWFPVNQPARWWGTSRANRITHAKSIVFARVILYDFFAS